MLKSIGIEPVNVRQPADLESVDMIVLPGGESTTMSQLLDYSGLRDPLIRLVKAGTPTLATCAGAVLLSREVSGDRGSIRVDPLGLLDCTADRNAYGRQRESFTAEIDVDWNILDFKTQLSAFSAVFIRAPELLNPGAACRIAASLDGRVCMVRQDNIVASVFHPELSGEAAVHQAVARFT